jgi:hypothetical protein
MAYDYVRRRFLHKFLKVGRDHSSKCGIHCVYARQPHLNTSVKYSGIRTAVERNYVYNLKLLQFSDFSICLVIFPDTATVPRTLIKMHAAAYNLALFSFLLIMRLPDS